MIHFSADINQYIHAPAGDADFPDAPLGWSRDDALEIARDEKIDLSEAHWDVVRALQHYYARHDDGAPINLRELHDALDERFHAQGGLRHLYTLFPGGPIAQSCRLAGLKAPFTATDRSFGSVA